MRALRDGIHGKAAHYHYSAMTPDLKSQHGD